jgi:flagellar biosynthesis GTPase FlhF
LHIVAGKKKFKRLPNVLRDPKIGHNMENVSVFLLGNINPVVEFNRIAAIDFTKEDLEFCDLVTLILLPMSGKDKIFNIKRFKDCYQVGQKIFNSPDSTPNNKAQEEVFRNLTVSLYFKMLPEEELKVLLKEKEMIDIVEFIESQAAEKVLQEDREKVRQEEREKIRQEEREKIRQEQEKSRQEQEKIRQEQEKYRQEQEKAHQEEWKKFRKVLLVMNNLAKEPELRSEILSRFGFTEETYQAAFDTIMSEVPPQSN